MISFAQACEDVLLHRALHTVHHDRGFYIDVGAYHPTNDSVTKHFYDHQWRGVNVEPSRELFGAFVEHRPRDINIQAAVSDQPGSVMFHQVEGQLGTVDADVANTHVSAGIPSQSYSVPSIALSTIFEQHAPADVHFLKVDVEGHEAAALRSMDFRRFRPWILVIEATEPNRLDRPTHHEWEGMVMCSGYHLACSDLPNRYYVAAEHGDLLPLLSLPADRYVAANLLDRINSLEMRLEHAMQTINGLTLAA